MHLLQKIDACKEEVIDLWFYLYAMEQDVIAEGESTTNGISLDFNVQRSRVW